ncbi:MAG: hypothetical protein V7727_02180 [Sneathiella sp.]
MSKHPTQQAINGAMQAALNAMQTKLKRAVKLEKLTKGEQFIFMTRASAAVFMRCVTVSASNSNMDPEELLDDIIADMKANHLQEDRIGYLTAAIENGGTTEKVKS